MKSFLNLRPSCHHVPIVPLIQDNYSDAVVIARQRLTATVIEVLERLQCILPTMAQTKCAQYITQMSGQHTVTRDSVLPSFPGEIDFSSGAIFDRPPVHPASPSSLLTIICAKRLNDNTVTTPAHHQEPPAYFPV